MLHKGYICCTCAKQVAQEVFLSYKPDIVPYFQPKYLKSKKQTPQKSVEKISETSSTDSVSGRQLPREANQKRSSCRDNQLS